MENLSLYSSGGAGGRMYPAGQHMVGSTLLVAWIQTTSTSTATVKYAVVEVLLVAEFKLTQVKHLWHHCICLLTRVWQFKHWNKGDGPDRGLLRILWNLSRKFADSFNGFCLLTLATCAAAGAPILGLARARHQAPHRPPARSPCHHVPSSVCSLAPSPCNPFLSFSISIMFLLVVLFVFVES